MTKYMINGSTVRLGNDLDMQVEDTLRPNFYSVSIHPELGFYLSIVPAFDIPKKIYGDADKMSSRILTTFHDRTGTTGALLSGVKGSGKSLTMKLTALKAVKAGLPVLVVSSAFCGDGFNKFIQAIDQDCVLVFDEFEKVYSEQEKQEALLTLFDGVYSTKKLFLLTANDAYRVNQYMNNRPGRIYYAVQYRGLTPEFIREFCDDVLKNKEYTNQIVAVSAMFQDFNFDMLKALCEELNRYGESIKDALDVLNIKQDTRNYLTYRAKMFNGEVELKDEQFDDNIVNNPFGQQELEMSVDTGEDDWEEVIFYPYGEDTKRSPDLRTVEMRNGKFRLILTRKSEDYTPTYYNLL